MNFESYASGENAKVTSYLSAINNGKKQTSMAQFLDFLSDIFSIFCKTLIH